jgi:hypothetical protein
MQTKVSDGSVLVSGTVSRAAECKRVGAKETPKTTFSIAAGKRQDTTTVFVNCVAWRDLALALANLQKGDSFFGIGQIKTRTYKGKEYTDLELEFGISPSAYGITKLSDLPDDAEIPDKFKDHLPFEDSGDEFPDFPDFLP